MIHYTCDGCRTRLQDDAKRYVVAIDVRRADLDDDDDCDCGPDGPELESEAWKKNGEKDDDRDLSRSWRFDLCPACYRAYMRDPLMVLTLRRGQMRN